MNTFNPWFFANNQQSSPWSFTGTNDNPFAQLFQFRQGGNNPFALPSPGQFDLHQTMQFWQQQMQQLASHPLLQQSNPEVFQTDVLTQVWQTLDPMNPANQQANQAAVQFIQRCAQGVSGEELLRSAQDYAGTIMRTTWQQTNGVSDFSAMQNICEQMRSALQWSLDQFGVYSSTSAEMQCGCVSLRLWLDCLNGLIDMSIAYSEFSSQVSNEFSEYLVERIQSDKLQLDDERKLLLLFSKHYEAALTKWLQSDAYRAVYGRYINAITASKVDQQQYIDAIVENFGLPSKREMDSTHKRAHEQAQKIRALEKRIAAQDSATKSSGGDDCAQLRSELANAVSRLQVAESELNGLKEQILKLQSTKKKQTSDAVKQVVSNKKARSGRKSTAAKTRAQVQDVVTPKTVSKETSKETEQGTTKQPLEDTPTES